MERGAEHAGIGVLVIRWVDDEPQPGIVECRLTDRFGKVWTIIEKCSVVGLGELYNDSRYPQPGVIGCRIISIGSDECGREFAVVDTELPWGVNAVNGETRFEVFADQLEQI